MAAVLMRRRALALFGLILLMVVSEPAVAGNYQVTVEPGGVVTLDVMGKDGAPPNVKLGTVGTASHGNATITSDGRSVSYRAMGDYVGGDAFTYQGKDTTTNQEYSGRVDVNVVAPQRIVGLDYARVAGVLGIILVLAIVLETGLATLFNWKWFQDYLEGKGLRTPIAVLVSWFFVYFYGLDVVSDLLSAFTAKGASFDKTLPGQIITAFIVAGGSGTVNRLFAALGLRPPVQDPTPDSRQQAQFVLNLTRGANLAPNAPVTVKINNQLVWTLQNQATRFPAQGTYSLPPGPYQIHLEGPSNAVPPQPLAADLPVSFAPSANVVIPMTLGA